MGKSEEEINTAVSVLLEEDVGTGEPAAKDNGHQDASEKGAVDKGDEDKHEDEDDESEGGDEETLPRTHI